MDVWMVDGSPDHTENNLHEISQIGMTINLKMSINWNLQNKQNKHDLDKQIEQINIHN